MDTFDEQLRFPLRIPDRLSALSAGDGNHRDETIRLQLGVLISPDLQSGASITSRFSTFRKYALSHQRRSSETLKDITTPLDFNNFEALPH
jgi:hypothetical protein